MTVPVTITNTGAAPEAYFVDARLNSNYQHRAAKHRPAQEQRRLRAASDRVVYRSGSSRPRHRACKAAASATLPIIFDYGPNQGDPDLVGAPGTNNTAAGPLHARPAA